MKTYLSQYLYSERMRRGYESISDYLKNYSNLPISEPYYRDIESGRKKIKPEKAGTLCAALQLEKKEFYFHLLKDILPKDVIEEIVKPVGTTTFASASEEFEKLNKKVLTLRRGYAKKVFEEPYIVPTEIVTYLDNNFELLPLIHFIYMKYTCSYDQLREIIKINAIRQPLSQIIRDFEKHNIARINRKKNSVSRYSPVFRIPRSQVGTKFKDRFLKHEIEKSLVSVNRDQLISSNNTFIYSSILCIKNGEDLETVSDKLTELLAELDVRSNKLDEPKTVPYFISITFSSREEYDHRKGGEGNN